VILQEKKILEEFFTDKETLDLEKFQNLGIIKNELKLENQQLQIFEETIAGFRNLKSWSKEDIVELFHIMIPNFGHKEKGKYLDSKM